MKDFLNLPKAIGTALGAAHKKALDSFQWVDKRLDELDETLAHSAAPSSSERVAFLDEVIRRGGTAHVELRGRVYKIAVTDYGPSTPPKDAP